jgi:hypothetical protein
MRLAYTLEDEIPAKSEMFKISIFKNTLQGIGALVYCYALGTVLCPAQHTCPCWIRYDGKKLSSSTSFK